jgi:hypothetical protein
MVIQKNTVRDIDLASLVEGKRFSDEEHKILERRDGSQIRMRFRENKPIEFVYAPVGADRITVNLERAAERTDATLRLATMCVWTVHREKEGAECTMTTRYLYKRFQIFGEEIDIALLCVVEGCEAYEDWF